MKKFFLKKKILSMSFLDEWSLVKVTGKDKKKFLQNQITSDINILKNNKYIFCGHCNFKGKILSTLFIFKKKNSYFYILRKSICKKQIQFMKNYSIFFDIKIKKIKKFSLLGISGFSSEQKLKKIFDILPNKKNVVVHIKDITIIYFNSLIKKFLLIIPQKKICFFEEKFKKLNFINDKQEWLLINIIENTPIIEKQTSLLFFPQEINLHKFKNALNFKKGCYIGQEQIAKIKYKNLNKKKLCILYCNFLYNNFSSGDFVYVKIKNSWVKKGILLSSVKVKKNIIYAQVVLNRFFKKNYIYRINNINFKNLV
ncbi:tRNA-modifying protein YgfZ [Buchnera aphidicola (Periphyllus testudinaceus)]|uniref:tRNA-modifying protein YgfZ n=1 Tax=Buchnera aphidicola TaxID=9 RepID=UPI003463B30F